MSPDQFNRGALPNRLAAAAALISVGVGCLVLIGWALDIEFLRSVLPSLSTMKANTALSFLLLGVSLWLLRRENPRGSAIEWKTRAGQFCALLVALISLVTLCEHAFGWNAGIDQLLFKDTVTAAGTAAPGRMGVNAAAAFLLLALAFLFLDKETSRGRRLAQPLALAAILIALVALIGYLYRVAAFYAMASDTQMALHTTLSFLILGVGTLSARPQVGMTATFIQDRVGGILLRRMLPVIVGLPLVFGWLRLKGERLGYYDTGFGTALFAASNIVFFAFFLWISARHLNRVDDQRQGVLAELGRAHAELELRVEKRTAQLAQTNEALRNSEKWLATTLGSIGDAVIATDQNGSVTFLNAVAQELTGWTQEEAQGKSLDLVFDIVNAETRQPVENPVKKVFRAGKVVGLGDHTVLISKDRREFDIEDSAAPIVTGEGERIGAVLVFRDVTDRKRIEEERDRFFNLSLDMICIAGFDGYFKQLNPAWEKTLGFTVEELLARPYLDFIHPEDRERTAAEAQRQAAGKNAISFENRYLCKDGSYKWLLWNATPLPDRQLIYAVAHEFTARKRDEAALHKAKEEAVRSSQFKDQFLSTMSHELRTPLNAVMGFSELLADERFGPLSEKQLRYLGHIHSGGQHLLKLINDILDLSKIEAGRLELAIEEVPVATAFAEVFCALRPLADKKSLKLIHTGSTALAVRADAMRFKQILMNLLGNAIKFTPQDGQIELAAHAVDSKVRVEVRDTGPGIPLEEQKRIFESFYRLRQSGQSPEGTGLGLTITQRLVELHGGELNLESVPGQGSCFYFSLPAMAGFEKAPTTQERGLEQAGGVSKILVIEDDPVAAQLIATQLFTSGYEPVICDQPRRAVDLAFELQPKAITLDLLMSPVNGWEILLELKNDLRTRDIPVIVVSIVDQPGMGMTLGAEEYLIKPVEQKTLLAAIERCIGTRKEPGMRPILVVEDDAPAREVIADLLRSQGYAVSAAENGAQARASVEASLPALVVLDLLLPNVSGFELLAEWRASPRTADVPVFVLTGKDLTHAEQATLRAHAELLLRKQQPWQEELIQQLRRVVPQTPLEGS